MTGQWVRLAICWLLLVPDPFYIFYIKVLFQFLHCPASGCSLAHKAIDGLQFLPQVVYGIKGAPMMGLLLTDSPPKGVFVEGSGPKDIC